MYGVINLMKMSSKQLFLKFWFIGDIGKAFSCHYPDIKSLLDSGFIKYVTYEDIGMQRGNSHESVTKQICDNNSHVKITELGEEVLYMEAL